jgi:hypothetical protein
VFVSAARMALKLVFPPVSIASTSHHGGRISIAGSTRRSATTAWQWSNTLEKYDDIRGRLAFNAIFEGTGLYWTLRSTYEHWLSLDRSSELRSEAVEAWERIEERKEVFERLRAEQFLGARPENQADVAAVNRIFAVLRTAACQVGLTMAMASVAL